jgi:hypothetical protein
MCYIPHHITGYHLFGCAPSEGGYIGGCNVWAGGENAACAKETDQTKCEAHTGDCSWVNTTAGGTADPKCVSIAYNAMDGPGVRNAMQRKVMETTRLKIPASFYGETTHCGGARGTTVFPMPCSQGSSWNTKLVSWLAAEPVSYPAGRLAKQ